MINEQDKKTLPEQSKDIHPYGMVTSDGPGPEYDTDKKRHDVSDMYHEAAKEAEHSHEIFDNRTGFTTPENIEKLHHADDVKREGVRGRAPADSGQYGEGGKDPTKP